MKTNKKQATTKSQKLTQRQSKRTKQKKTNIKTIRKQNH